MDNPVVVAGLMLFVFGVITLIVLAKISKKTHTN